jgi:plastocyanin
MERNGRRVGLVALAVIVLMISAAACSKDTPSSTGSTGTTTTTVPTEEPSDSGGGGGTIAIGDDQANDHGSADVTGTDETKLEQDNFYFNPTVLTGSAGQSLKIELDNEGSVPHTFTIDDQNVDVQVEPGEDASVDVTFPDSGFVEFYCRFHRGSGMAGELKVA